jgi:hypothetical protein
MLTIDNILKLEGTILPNGYMVERITIAPDIYIFQLGKQHTIYNPNTFQPNVRFHNKSFTLDRNLDDVNPFYMLADESSHYTWVNNDSLRSLDAFKYKLNELTNLWS